MNKFENEIQFQFVHILCLVTLIFKNIATHHCLLFFWIDCKIWRWLSYLFILKLRLFHLSYLSPIPIILWLRLCLLITSTCIQAWGPWKSSPLPGQEHPYLAGAEMGCTGSLSAGRGEWASHSGKLLWQALCKSEICGNDHISTGCLLSTARSAH